MFRIQVIRHTSIDGSLVIPGGIVYEQIHLKAMPVTDQYAFQATRTARIPGMRFARHQLILKELVWS